MRVESKLAEVSGGRLSYSDAGEGHPVLLLHGFPTSSLLWRREVTLLATRMRVIVPDLLGYGESAKPLEADLGIVAQARYVRELMEQLAISEVAVVGHDAGGAVARLLALHGDVRALVLLDSAPLEEWPPRWVGAVASAADGDETTERVEEVLRRTFQQGMHKATLDEAVFQAYLRPWREGPQGFFRAARALDRAGVAGEARQLASLDVPAFVIWGEDDPFLPSAMAERLGDTLQGSTVALLPGCSHFVNEDAPQTVGPLIYEFLRYRYLGEAHGHPASGPVSVFLERPPSPQQPDWDPDPLEP